MFEYSYLIFLVPLVSAFIIFFFGRWLPMRGASLGLLAIGYTLVRAILIFTKISNDPSAVSEVSISWFQFGIYQMEIGVLIDSLSALMLVVVTVVSFLVHLYSLGYMHGDPRFKRYYSYLSFFTFAMLFLVVANNYLQIFIGWELVGAASYLLIGFWFEKSSAASAGRKAFITTKFGDLGFFIAILMIFSLLGTLNFHQVQGRIEEGLISIETAGMIGLLLFCGAMGKSAQVPFHVWLPDAMEGPTPVSALIHAATMVAAGVYLVARSYFVFEFGSFSLDFVAWIGLITAFVAASMALVANDIKRVLAFSTVSQLGYMMIAMGVGGRTAGMYHLTTHAFFKALLFLGAGSVIHATHTNDIQEMGGLSKKMFWTFGTFTFAWLAISGIWPFAGFFSKDTILEAVHHSGNHLLFWSALFVAFMTSFYMTRLYFLVFLSHPRNENVNSHAHESPWVMTLPLAILAFLSLTSGLFFHYFLDIHTLLPEQHGVKELIQIGAMSESVKGAGGFIPVVSTMAAVFGILLSYMFYQKNIFSAEKIAVKFKGIYFILTKKYGFDEFYIKALVLPADAFAAALDKLDYHVFDQLGVDGVGRITVLFSKIHDWFDMNVVDPLVDFWGKTAVCSGQFLRKFQTGFVQNYVFLIVFGFGLIIIWKLF